MEQHAEIQDMVQKLEGQQTAAQRKEVVTRLLEILVRETAFFGMAPMLLMLFPTRVLYYSSIPFAQ
jgi:hypothetical protein